MDGNFRAGGDSAATGMPAAESFGQAEHLSAAMLMSMIDELDVGMLVCDAGGVLIHANAAGQQALRWSGLLSLRQDNEVCAAQPAQRPLLQGAMTAAVSGRRRLVLLKHENERLMVAVQPLDASGPGQANGAAAPRMLLLLGRRTVATGLVVQMLCQMHALTGAEQRVLEGLLCGHSADALAQRFGVKLSTVRTQVSTLRTKLGVSRVTDALLMAAELPPMAGALRFQRPGPGAERSAMRV